MLINNQNKFLSIDQLIQEVFTISKLQKKLMLTYRFIRNTTINNVPHIAY